MGDVRQLGDANRFEPLSADLARKPDADIVFTFGRAGEVGQQHGAVGQGEHRRGVAAAKVLAG